MKRDAKTWDYATQRRPFGQPFSPLTVGAIQRKLARMRVISLEQFASCGISRFHSPRCVRKSMCGVGGWGGLIMCLCSVREHECTDLEVCVCVGGGGRCMHAYVFVHRVY